MIKIMNFEQGAKRPNEYDELHNLIDMCFSEYDSFSMQFIEDTVEDTIKEINAYCASKGIQVDQVYIDGSLYVERVTPDQSAIDMPTISANGNGVHKPKKAFTKRFSNIVKEVASQLILDSPHEIFIATDAPAGLQKSFANYALNYNLGYKFRTRSVEGGLFVRKISKDG